MNCELWVTQLYEQSQTIRSTGKIPAMTPGRASLIALMHHYLNGFLDPTITLLELHKLMYFMQESGEPLRLKYKKAWYGPYAENLRHVLHAIDGYLISGYSDGGDQPDKKLELLPGAIEKANNFLAKHPATYKRLEQVSDLVDGFESPFGLELLSTIHWVMKKYNLISTEDIIKETYEWNNRKQQFTQRQIQVVIDTLSTKNWL